MARGWESKSVESQQTGDSLGGRRTKISADELERRKKREGLELSRGRIVKELENAHTEVHRAALRNALAYLDDELARLG